jgi:hypothetical protein
MITVNVRKIKPRIGIAANMFLYGSSLPKRWACHDDYFISGFGDTPAEAYADWKAKEARRARVKRYGIWNKKDCLAWFFQGCKVLRSYLGVQQIVGYDYSTDELILRG